MVRKIKKVRRVSKAQRGPQATGRDWYVAFDGDGQAALFIHKHGDTDDHSSCGPVVMCCERAIAPYKRLAPDLHTRVTRYQWQQGVHLQGWLDGGVGAMYFVLCDPNDPDAIYQFGLDQGRAHELVMGHRPLSAYRLPECRFTAAQLG